MPGRPTPEKIITGQKIEAGKGEAARSMRLNMTDAEKVLWSKLRRNGLGGIHFRRQTVIRGFIVDFYCHQSALAIEVDGPIHDPQSDVERDSMIAGAGIRTIRFTNEEVFTNIEGVLDRIHAEARVP